MKLLTSIISFSLVCVASCEQSKDSGSITKNQPELTSWSETDKAWSGAAEISVYKLKQERYGKLIDGEAMLIYVREPFLKDKQVKDESGRGDFQVLKLNATREFKTGVYPYHILMSVFQPLENSVDNKALKVTTSIQDWCGHVFIQTNRMDGYLKTDVRSYFENEDGKTFKEKEDVLLEDEIWTSLRLQPTELPVGEVKIVPGSLASRFGRLKMVSTSAVTRWIEGESEDTVIYEVTYIDSGRTLAIEISIKSPYFIIGWKETGRAGVLSSGKLKKRIDNIDYWNYSDEKKGIKLRKQLGLE